MLKMDFEIPKMCLHTVIISNVCDSPCFLNWTFFHSTFLDIIDVFYWTFLEITGQYDNCHYLIEHYYMQNIFEFFRL